jgi:hypothetical protein
MRFEDITPAIGKHLAGFLGFYTTIMMNIFVAPLHLDDERQGIPWHALPYYKARLELLRGYYCIVVEHRRLCRPEYSATCSHARRHQQLFIEEAAGQGMVDVCAWGVERGMSIRHDAIIYAVLKGHTQIMDWALREYMFLGSWNHWSFSMRWTRFDPTLQFATNALLERPNTTLPVPLSVLGAAAYTGSLHVMRAMWYRSHDGEARMDESDVRTLIRIAGYRGHQCIIDFIMARGYTHLRTEALIGATLSEDLMHSRLIFYVLTTQPRPPLPDKAYWNMVFRDDAVPNLQNYEMYYTSDAFRPDLEAFQKHALMCGKADVVAWAVDFCTRTGNTDLLYRDGLEAALRARDLSLLQRLDQSGMYALNFETCLECAAESGDLALYQWVWRHRDAPSKIRGLSGHSFFAAIRGGNVSIARDLLPLTIFTRSDEERRHIKRGIFHMVLEDLVDMANFWLGSSTYVFQGKDDLFYKVKSVEMCDVLERQGAKPTRNHIRVMRQRIGNDPRHFLAILHWMEARL